MRPELLALFLHDSLPSMQMQSIVGKLAGALPLSVVFHGTNRALADGEELTKAQVRERGEEGRGATWHAATGRDAHQ